MGMNVYSYDIENIPLPATICQGGCAVLPFAHARRPLALVPSSPLVGEGRELSRSGAERLGELGEVTDWLGSGSGALPLNCIHWRSLAAPAGVLQTAALSKVGSRLVDKGEWKEWVAEIA